MTSLSIVASLRALYARFGLVIFGSAWSSSGDSIRGKGLGVELVDLFSRTPVHFEVSYGYTNLFQASETMQRTCEYTSARNTSLLESWTRTTTSPPPNMRSSFLKMYFAVLVDIVNVGD